MANGISTRPLDLNLSPFELTNQVVDKSYHPFSNLCSCKMNKDVINYQSSEQMFYHLLAKLYNQSNLVINILKSDDPIEIQAIIRNFNTLFANHLKKEKNYEICYNAKVSTGRLI